MKPVAFDYARPVRIGEALAAAGCATRMRKVLAGGPDAWAQCSICASRSRRCWSTSRASPSWRPCSEDARSITIGATVTHARHRGRPRRRSDRRLSCPGRARHRLPRRALARHASVAASPTPTRRPTGLVPDRAWRRGADARCAGARSVALAAFVRGAMETELAHDELLVGIRVPKFSRARASAIHKICRKTGEFAEAIGVVAHDPTRDVTSARRQHCHAARRSCVEDVTLSSMRGRRDGRSAIRLDAGRLGGRRL